MADRNKMSWGTFLFPFQGRVARRDFWLRFVLPTMGIWFVLDAILPLNAFVRMIPVDEAQSNPWAMFTPLPFVMAAASIGAAITVGAKRFHDRDRSGWFLLAYLIPLIGQLWVLLELGFLRGTDGPNRFGADPLERQS